MRFEQTVGGKGEAGVASWLRRTVGQPTRMRPHSPYDMTINGWKIEAKCGNFSKGRWNISIHRHGKLKETADFYVFRLLGCPYWKTALHLVVPAPLKVKTVVLTPRTLISKWVRYVNAISQLEQVPAGVRRDSRLVEICGETKTVSEWLDRQGLNRDTYYARIDAGWSDQEAIFGRPLGRSQADRRRPRIEQFAALMRSRGKSYWRARDRRIAHGSSLRESA